MSNKIVTLVERAVRLTDCWNNEHTTLGIIRRDPRERALPTFSGERSMAEYRKAKATRAMVKALNAVAQAMPDSPHTAAVLGFAEDAIADNGEAFAGNRRIKGTLKAMMIAAKADQAPVQTSAGKPVNERPKNLSPCHIAAWQQYRQIIGGRPAMANKSRSAIWAAAKDEIGAAEVGNKETWLRYIREAERHNIQQNADRNG